MPPYRLQKNRLSKPKRPQVDTSLHLPRSLLIPGYSLPQSDYNNISLALDSCYAPSTQKSHSSSLRHFIAFCDEREIPEELRLPTHEVILLAYAAFHIGRFAGGTARHRISALKSYHNTNNLSWKGSSRLSKILKGVSHKAPHTATRAPRSPVTTTMLKHLLSSLDLNIPLDAAVAACACTAFWGQCRLGELLPTSSTTPTTSIPTRSHLTCSASKQQNQRSYELFLPCTKTNRRGQPVTLLKQNNRTNPLSLLQHHLAVSKLPPTCSLFEFRHAHSSLPTLLSKRRFLARCNNIWSKLGYSRITGHCFRIGGTSKLLASGIPPDVVKTMGRWSSDSFLRYWRHLDRIAPAQTPHTIPKRRND